MKKFVCQCALMGELYVMDLALWLIFFSTVTMTSSEDSVEAYLNRCLDGVNHKTKPGPESNLFGQCNQYKELSCCTEETTRGLHQSHSWLNFNWHHCDTQLSKACTAFLNHDLCFYECSPNVAPWLVPVCGAEVLADFQDTPFRTLQETGILALNHNISIRNERYKGIPLCESECNAWWDACRYDLTCKDNWALGWDWSAGVNVCPAGTTCRTFEDVFGSAANMCHQIWAGAFNVTADNEQCMVFYFSDTNPNREVARYYAERMLKESSIATNSAVELSSSIFIFLFSLIVYILHHYHLCYHVVSRTEL